MVVKKVQVQALYAPQSGKYILFWYT